MKKIDLEIEVEALRNEQAQLISELKRALDIIKAFAPQAVDMVPYRLIEKIESYNKEVA